MSKFWKVVKEKCRCCCSSRCCRCRSGDYKVELELPVVQPKPPSSERDVEDGTKAGVLAVEDLDFCIDYNGIEHSTGKYDLMTREKDKCLVVRRGHPFKLDLKLNRPYENYKDAISFIFTVADVEKPNLGQGTVVAIPMLETTTYENGGWTCYFKKQMDNHLIVMVTPASDCIVASWKIDIDTKLINGRSLNYMHPLPIYVLFNAWCPYDQVYMPDQSQREEYVLEEGGIMWRGTKDIMKPTPWNYAQYGKDILDCCLYLIKNVGKVRGFARGDAIAVTRAASAAVNAQDDNGVVFGNWSEDFGGGKEPTKWVGSLNILQEYFNKKKPVKYGQCWVFAGVLNTVCRTVGIPCRPVSGYNIAHDSEGSLVLECYYNEDGKLLDELNSDSIWSFHVWNEAWMNRPDLGNFFDGWQVIDATPQELSDSLFRLGPSSVTAVREGDVTKPYDNGFVFAEVNADVVYWKYYGHIEPLKLISTDTMRVGHKISTKAVGGIDRVDLTRRYKYTDNFKKQRETMEKALRRSHNLLARYYLNEQFNEVKFSFKLRSDIVIGQDFDVILSIQNISSYKDYEVKGNLQVHVVTYTGKVGDTVKKFEFEEKIEAGGSKEILLPVTFFEYYPRLLPQSAFNIVCMASVPNTDYDYFAQDDFRVRNPDIKITIDGTPVSKREFQATVRVKNSLPITLRKGKFYIQGVGLEEQMKVSIEEAIPPGEYAEAVIKITPPWAGRHQLSAKFQCKEMGDIDGFLVFIVHNNPEFNGTVNNGLENNEL